MIGAEQPAVVRASPLFNLRNQMYRGPRA